MWTLCWGNCSTTLHGVCTVRILLFGQEQLVQGPDSNHNLSASTSTQGQQFSALLPELWALLAKTAHLTFSNVWSKWLRRFALCYFAVGWVCKGTLC